MPDRSLRRRMKQTEKALHKVEQSISCLIDTFLSFQLAVLHSTEMFEQFSDKEKNIWLRHTLKMLQVLKNLQHVLHCKQQFIRDWNKYENWDAKWSVSPTEAEALEIFTPLLKSHPHEWIKIRHLLHDIFVLQKKMTRPSGPYTTKIRTRPWLASRLHHLRSDG